ncbi:MAG TPA: hypothetical protein VMV78_12240 [Thiobacillus sp.]|jgi:hypothetical protein|nr:hypothetical protein [Thiobacillus sp.]
MAGVYRGMVDDAKTGFAIGNMVRIRRNDYTVAGLTRRMVSSDRRHPVGASLPQIRLLEIGDATCAFVPAWWCACWPRCRRSAPH